MQDGCDSIHSATEVMCLLSDKTVCFQQIKAVHFNNTPISDMVVHLYYETKGSSHLLQNLRTGSDGVAAFSLNTTDLDGDITLTVSEIILNLCL